MHLNDNLCHSGHKINAGPEISDLKLEVHSFTQEVNAILTDLQDIRDATKRQNIVRFTMICICQLARSKR